MNGGRIVLEISHAHEAEQDSSSTWEATYSVRILVACLKRTPAPAAGQEQSQKAIHRCAMQRNVQVQLPEGNRCRYGDPRASLAVNRSDRQKCCRKCRCYVLLRKLGAQYHAQLLLKAKCVGCQKLNPEPCRNRRKICVGVRGPPSAAALPVPGASPSPMSLELRQTLQNVVWVAAMWRC